MKKTIKILVTGAAGQISYNLLFRIANGEMFGPNQKMVLHLLELPVSLDVLKGVKMELIDCAFPLLEDVLITDRDELAYEGIDWAFLLGAKPRGPGMQRSDLIRENGPIFKKVGQALNTYASPNVRVIVVGNPCNTNCLIAMSNAPKIPKENFHAMTLLDQNRAKAQLALKAKVNVDKISKLVIWGNHSSTQIPDFYNAQIGDKKVEELIFDENYLKEEFTQVVAERGSAIIKARGRSSSASAAIALMNHVQFLVGIKKGVFSSCVLSDGNCYDIPNGIIFSFPCQLDDEGNYFIVPNFKINDYLRKKIKQTADELLEERRLVQDLI